MTHIIPERALWVVANYMALPVWCFQLRGAMPSVYKAASESTQVVISVEINKPTASRELHDNFCNN